MKLATWNVNSIRARRERVLDWIRANEPDVLCLQELKTEERDFPREDFRALGYEAAVHAQRTYNGVAILSRSPLADIERGFGDGGDESQARFVAATTAGGIRVMSVYVPNGEAVGSEKFAYKLAWCERLVAYLAGRLTPDAPGAVCGDFNVAPAEIDVHDPASWQGHVLFSAEERAAFRRIIDCGLVDIVRQLNPREPMYSWWDYRQLAFPKNRGLRIDHLLLTPALARRAAAAHVDRNARKGKLPSDHAPVVVEVAAA